MRALLALLALLSLLLVPRARAQEAGVEGALLEAVEVGFDGATGWNVPAPLWVTLANPRQTDLEVQVVARSALATATRAVQLPVGARKRVALALVLEGEVRLEVRLGDRPVAQVPVDHDPVPIDRHLLVLDGRPRALWTAAATVRADEVLRHTTIEAAAAPTEASCYMAVAAVLLRETDPAGWTHEQREALLEWVREGGLLLVAGVTPKAPALAAFFEGLLASAPETTKLAGRAARLRRAGFGAVAAFADDPLLLATTQADAKQRLGDLLAAAAARRGYPRPSDAPDATPFTGPGARTQLLVGGFIAGYFLAVGPLLALLLRRARRARLALGTAALVLGFTLLAPAVAGLVRTGRGEARHRSVLWVPAAGGGPALELGEVAVLSGGGTSYRLELEGRGLPGLSATVLEAWTRAEHRYGPAGWGWVEPQPAVVRTTRGPRATVEVDMPPWGEQRVLTHALRDDVRPVTATVSFDLAGAMCTIDNTSGTTLERAVLVPDLDGQRHGDPTYVPVGDLAPGAWTQVALPRGLPGRSVTFAHALDLPADWRSWAQLRRPAPDASSARPQRTASRYVLASRTRPAISASGPRLEVVEHTLRLDEVAVAPPRPRGFLGVRLTDADGGVVADPMQGGPAERGGLRAGDVVRSIDGAPVASSGQLRALIAERAPGDVVTLVVRGADGLERTHRVKLARAPGE